MTHPVRTTLRKLGRSPSFSAIAILTLALGIGANAAIFSVVYGVLLQPLHFEEPDRLVAVRHAAPGIGLPELPNSEATFMTYKTQAHTIESIGLASEDVVNVTGLDRPVRLDAARVTAGLFDALRVRPVLGPGLTAADTLPDADPVVVISNAAWKNRFGADPQIVGRMLRLDGVDHRIVGVLPAGFTYGSADTELWLPHTIDPDKPVTGNFNDEAVARLAPGATVADAQRELENLLPRMVELYPGDITADLLKSSGLQPTVQPLKDYLVGDAGDVLWILLGTVGLILLIACANVANLFLVRSEGRVREVAVRTALGAGRGSLARGFLAESVALGLAGGALGLILAIAGVRALVAFGPDSIPRLDEVGVGLPVLAFTVVVSVVAGLLFGLVPMLRFNRAFSLVAALKEGGRGSSTGRERHLARNALVVAQVALALVLLVGSGLMLRSFQSLRSVEPGFQPAGLLTLRVSLPEAEYPDGHQVADFFQRLDERLRQLPGVEAAAAGAMPMGGQMSRSAHSFEGQPVPEGSVPPIERNVRVAPGYFETIRQPLLAGRTFEDADAQKPRAVAIVNRAMAEKHWPGQDPLGKRLQMGMPDPGGADDWDAGWYTVVGVVGNTRFEGLDEDEAPMIYYANGPWAVEDHGWFDRTLTVVVRTAGGVHPLALAEPVRQTIWELDPNLPVANVRTAQKIVDESMARTSFTMVLLLIAAAVALVLGAVGLYGVISYIVSLRTQEIGIRMALGADAGDVARKVVRQGLAVAGLGAVLGIGAAFALTRLMASLLFGVSPTDPLTFAGVSGALMATAALASWLPARRAAGVDPLVALRHE